MTLTVKDSLELKKPGNSAAPSPDSENKSMQNNRSNPVCLEVEITIRSLPSEAACPTQPIREEGKTVIVFDNGAVIRSTKNLPVGQKVILSNSKGRDVVCQVVGGRTTPNIKGYVEIEFIEAVNDFWRIHEDAGPLAGVTPPPAPVDLHDSPSSASTLSSVASTAPQSSGKSAAGGLGQAPSFEDIPGLLSTPIPPPARESKNEPSRLGLGKDSPESSKYNLSEIANPSSTLANWSQPAQEASANRKAAPESSDASSVNSTTTPAAREFMSKGLMAYEQAKPSASASNGKLPLIAGLVVFVVALVCGGVFYLRRSSVPVSVARTEVQSQPLAPVSPAANNSAAIAPSQPNVEPQLAAQAIAGAQPSVSAEAQPAPAPTPLPDIVIGPATADARTDSHNSQRQTKKTAAIKQPEAESPRQPMIQNLKMNSPIAPQQRAANSGDGSAPIADISANAGTATPASAGLLTTAGRTSNPPTPPPGATVVFPTASLAPAPAAAPATGAISSSAGRAASTPKLLSSTRVVYPPSARQSNIQGSVTLSLSIDGDGNVVAAKTLSGPMPLRQAALDSVKQWKYSPAAQEGKPVPAQVTVSVEFHLR